MMKARGALWAAVLVVSITLVVIAGALARSPDMAQGVTVIDGDTIRLDGTTFRLWGIDAPEARQDCRDGWPAGREATAHLRRMIDGQGVSCEPRTIDRYGRTVALCRENGRDIGADMVSAGMAWA